MAVKTSDMKPGEILEVFGDCPTFERDVRKWCERLGKVLLSVNQNGTDVKKIQIQF
jgi:tRNA 2-thiouridine synthesizing protein A